MTSTAPFPAPGDAPKPAVGDQNAGVVRRQAVHVDEAALLDALRGNRLGGAVLDVFDEEPLPRGHPLWKLDNVVITPHISGPSAPVEIAPIFNDNLRRYLTRRPLRYVVDRERGY